jgi:hypothetical protein
MVDMNDSIWVEKQQFIDAITGGDIKGGAWVSYNWAPSIIH